jgi:hypothetical protein
MENNCSVLSNYSPKSGVDRIIAPYQTRQSEIQNGAARFPIIDCRYNIDGKSGRAIMMNPSADQIAIWVVSACKNTVVVTSNRFTEDECMVIAARMIWLQANAQFPITGMVVEPAENCKKSWEGQALFGFRDGVTVGLAGTPLDPDDCLSDPCAPINPSEKCPKTGTVSPTCTRNMSANEIDSAIQSAATKTASDGYARLSNLSRQKRFGNGNGGQCPTSAEGYIASIGSNTYPLLEEWLKTGKIEERFRCRKLRDRSLLARKC